jgi:hypothetical protein
MDKEENGSGLLKEASQHLLEDWETCQDRRGPSRESRSREYQNEVPHHGLKFNDSLMNSEMELFHSNESHINTT